MQVIAELYYRKIRNEVYHILPLYTNRSTTKKFPTKTFLEMMDCSVSNPEEVEYDKQNYLQHQKTQVSPNNSKWGLSPIATVQKSRSVYNKKVPNWNTFENNRF